MELTIVPWRYSSPKGGADSCIDIAEHDSPGLADVHLGERLMPSDGKSERDPKLQSALEASGFVGTWENDLLADRVYLSGSLIGLLGITPERAALGVSLSAFLDGIHPEDQERLSSALTPSEDSRRA